MSPLSIGGGGGGGLAVLYSHDYFQTTLSQAASASDDEIHVASTEFNIGDDLILWRFTNSRNNDLSLHVIDTMPTGQLTLGVDPVLDAAWPSGTDVVQSAMTIDEEHPDDGSYIQLPDTEYAELHFDMEFWRVSRFARRFVVSSKQIDVKVFPQEGLMRRREVDAGGTSLELVHQPVADADFEIMSNIVTSTPARRVVCNYNKETNRVAFSASAEDGRGRTPTVFAVVSVNEALIRGR